MNDVNRKADFNAINVMIIGVIVLVLLTVFSITVADYFTSAGKLGVCQASMLKANIIKEGTVGFQDSFISCNDLPDTDIKKNDVVKSNRIDDNLVKSKIADAMLSCWNTIGRGKADPFKRYEGDQAYCFICSDVIFDENFVKQAESEQYKLTDMSYWLATNTIPGYKTTYFEAFYNYTPDTRTTLEMKNQEPPFDISKQYVIAWRMDADKDGPAIALLKFGVPVVAGAAAGKFLGAGIVRGATAGAILGTVLLLNSDGKIVSSSLMLMPKSMLAEKIKTEEGEKSVCTKLVNY